MARAKKNEASVRTHKAEVRMTKAEYEELKRCAAERQLSVSDWLRVLIFRRLPRPRATRLQIVDTRTPAELLRLGGNLRDLYNTYAKTGNFYPDETRSILDAIGRAVISIARCYDEYYRREFGDDRQGH